MHVMDGLQCAGAGRSVHRNCRIPAWPHACNLTSHVCMCSHLDKRNSGQPLVSPADLLKRVCVVVSSR